jgi:ABC-type lipoprotein release transport system permease subunit
MTHWLQRHLNILDYTLTSLLRRRLKNLSLILLYSLLVFVVASVMFFTRAMQREAELVLADAPDLVVQRMVAGRNDPVPLAYAGEIAAMRGVSAVTPRLWGYYYDRINGANYTLQAADDRGLSAASIDVGAGVARSRGIGKGDILTLTGSDNTLYVYEVNRTFEEASDLLTVDLVLMTTEDFRTFFAFPADRATDLAVYVRNPREIATVAAKVAERFPDSRPIMKDELLRTYASIFDWRGGMMIAIISMAALAFVIFAWDRASGLSAVERQEIGILKSIGWDTGDVLILKFWEGAVISLTAFLVGILAAYAHVFLMPAPLFAHALKGWAVLYPSFRLTPALDFYHLAVLFTLTVLPYLAATIVPSWRAASGDPDAAMRS